MPNNYTAALTKPLGPLPVWVWGVGAGLAISAGRWAWDKRRNLAADKAPGDEAGAAADVPPGGSAASIVPITPSPNAGAWAGPAPHNPNDPSTTAKPSTNVEWLPLAVDLLRRAGFDPLDANEALTKWLSGRAVTAVEQRMISQAIGAAGAPPAGAPNLVAVPTQAGNPAPPPAPPPPPVAPPQRPPTLRTGAVGPMVGRLQRWLNAATGATLKVDDQYGPKTAAAVAALQDGTDWDEPQERGVVDGPTWDLIAYIALQTHVPF